MTTGNLICSKCGFSNVPGDQFCGSCGSFLEWEGVPGEAQPGDPDIPVPGPGPGPGPAAGPPPVPPGGYPTLDPPTVPYPVAPETPPAFAGEVGAGLVRCPACGIANPAGRTFCQSCGNKLPDAARVEEATAAQIAAAVAAPNRPPVVQTRQANAEPDEEGSSGSLVKWLVAVAVLGAIVGIAVVAALTFLRSEGVTGASTAPSVVVPSSAAPSNAPADSGPPAAAVPLELTGADASSVVGDPDNQAFLATNVTDGDAKTAWKEGAADARDEFIEVTFAPARVTSIVVANGYNQSDTTFKRNPRLKDVLISINGGEGIPALLKDQARDQVIDVEPVDGASSVRITIVSVYDGSDVGDRKATQDAALNEIVVMGVTAQ